MAPMRSVRADRHSPPLVGAGRRLFSGVLPVALISTLLVGIASPAQADPRHLAPQVEQLDHHGQEVKPEAWAAATPPKRKPSAAPVWPTAGTAQISLPSTTSRVAVAPTKAGSLPVTVNRAKRRDGAPVSTMDVEVLNRAAVPAKWRDGVVMRFTTPETGSTANISVDYKKFENVYGGDWASRLRLWSLPNCALTTDRPAAHCTPTAVKSVNDSKTGKVTGDIAAGASSRTALVALAAAPSGSSGNFGATSLSASATWSAGGNSGGFGWSYPMRVPPSIGTLAPALALSYSSGSVDGHTEVTNNQPSWIGEGFDYAPGFIERSYVSCSQDMEEDVKGANNDDETGDQCWRNQNAMMSLNGSGGEIIYDEAKGWHARNETGAKIELLPGATNGDNDGEHWKVTTTDGTQYFFGLNNLPGQSSATNSAWTVPVAGNHANEPCHATKFEDSFCNQAWRWNLDYVIDVRGNTISYWYGNETNKYSQNMDEDKPASYTRGGYLDRIDYGTWDRGAADRSVTATAQVDFVPGDRCDTSNCDKHDGVNWPDTPWDQECTGSKCEEDFAPTFWSTKRLAKVTTRVWDTSKATPGWQDVDSWTLTHTFPDSSDGSIHDGMWLSSIVRTGHVGGDVSLPPVTFFPVSLPNRVFTPNTSTVNWQRIDYIVTETGGKIDLEWELPECSATKLPASAANNTMRCYPVRVIDPDDPKGERYIDEWWHQHRVKSVSESDLPTDVNGHTAAPRFTFYDYVGGPAWHYGEDNGLGDPEGLTWNQFRGYAEVRTRVGETAGQQTLTVAKFMRGMHGDRESAAGGTRTVKSTATLGTETVYDEDQFAGMLREETIYNGDESKPVSKTVNVPWRSNATAIRTAGVDASAYFVSSRATYEAVALGANGQSGWQVTRTQSKYDENTGLAEWVQNDGDLAKTGDEQCATTVYNHNEAKNLHLQKQLTKTALACGVQPTSADQVVTGLRNYYDGATSVDTAPKYGAVTKTETLADWTSAAGTTWQAQQQRTFDDFGRVLSETDARGNVFNSTYTPDKTGPVTKVTTTRPSPLNWVSSTELSPYWGTVTKSVDQNGGATTVKYDALGRTYRVWDLGWDYTGHESTPSSEYTYYYAPKRDAYPYTVSKKLNSGGGYLTTYDILDSLLRPRQTQTAAVGEGRVVSDTIYDKLGRAYMTYAPHVEPGEASGTVLWKPEWAVPAITKNEIDNAGRVTASIQLAGNNVDNLVEKWRTTTVHEGNVVKTTPPNGATPTTSVADAFGRTVELRQHTTPSGVNGPYQSTWYTYNARDELTKVIDNDKNEWRNTYDVKGRLIETVDPDKGKATNQYTKFDDLEKSTNANGQSLWYVYDNFGRKTELRNDSKDGALRAKWKYDVLYTTSTTKAKGQLTEAYRYEPAGSTNIYKWQAGGFNARYQPTNVNYVIPGAENSGLAATWSYAYGYSPYDGAATSIQYPGGGGLATETVTTEYDKTTGLPLNLKTGMTGVGSYVIGQLYTAYGEPTVTKRQTTGGTLIEDATYYDTHTRRVERTAVGPFGGSTVSDRSYQYTDAGTIIGLADTPQTGAADYQCFQQDALVRLVTAWTPQAATDCKTAAPSMDALGGPAEYWLDWSFDAVGNRTQEVSHTRAGVITRDYTMPKGGANVVQPHAVTAVTTRVAGTADTTTRYKYDSSGNTVCRPVDATANTCEPVTNSQSLSWDAEGRLSTAAAGGTGLQTNVFDADGARLIRRDASGTTLYLPGQEMRRAPNGTVTGTRYYSFGGCTVAMRTSVGLTWVYSDHQGTQHTLIDNTTLKVMVRRQLPYGDPRTDPIWPNQKGFVGGDNEPTGLVNIGARQYDDGLGRFISVDPLQDLKDPQQWNGYAYSHNSPVSFSDPTGLSDDTGCRSRACWDSLDDVKKGNTPATNDPKKTTNSGGYSSSTTTLPNGTVYVSNADGKGNASINGVAYNLQGTNVITTWEMALGLDRFQGDFPLQPAGVFDPHDEYNTTRGMVAAMRANYFTLRGFKEGDADAAWIAAKIEIRADLGNMDGIHNSLSLGMYAAMTSGAKMPSMPRLPGCTGRRSFSADTEVLLADGSTKQIKDVVIGDLVLATDPNTGEQGPRPVEAVWTHDDDLFVLTVNGNNLTTTEDHTFWNETDQLWEAAEDLDKGDLLRTPNSVAVIGNFNAGRKTTAAAYNLTVADLHSYYVLAGQTPILVHNDGGADFDFDYYDRPGYSNYVLVDKNNKPYYAGMFGPGESAAKVQRRHAKTFNRFNPANGDKINVFPGTRTYGESRLMEQRMTEAFETYIGEDGVNYRGNRQNPMALDKEPGYMAYEEFKKNGGCR